MLFFPKEKQNVGTVWHCHQRQHLALVRLGCRNSLTRRLNHHSHSGSNGQWTGKASVAAAPTFPKASMHQRLAVWGSTACSFQLWGAGLLLTGTVKRRAKNVPNTLTVSWRWCCKRWLWAFMESVLLLECAS